MPFVFSHVEYCDMHFVYGFCDGSARAAVEEYQRLSRPKVSVSVLQAAQTVDTGNLHTQG
jgi:hypothetical protein